MATETEIEAVKAALFEAFRDYGANLARLNDTDIDAVALRLAEALDRVRADGTRDGYREALEAIDGLKIAGDVADQMQALAREALAGKANRKASGISPAVRMHERDETCVMATETEIEAVKRAIVDEVDDHLRFNVAAYGTAWTGEGEDTEFIVGKAAEIAIAALDRVRADDTRDTETAENIDTLARLICHGIEALRDGDGDTFTAQATLANLDQLVRFSGGASAGGRTPPNDK